VVLTAKHLLDLASEGRESRPPPTTDVWDVGNVRERSSGRIGPWWENRTSSSRAKQETRKRSPLVNIVMIIIPPDKG